ncbi:MAG: nucleotide pyrophosphohydrolase [Candidatus Pacebacteria bacterium]|nr:nucleotide pyrophosphohydrolase [Candidatus Paceibacterota bacterium]
MDKLRKELIKFSEERDWRQFHTPENLAKSVSIEAGELLECFQWGDSFGKQEVEDEIADIFSYLILLEKALDIDLIEVTKKKIEKNKGKYPILKSKGSSKKYTKF